LDFLPQSSNGIVLQQALSTLGISCQIMSAIECDSIIDPYNWNDALHALEKGRILIFVGGTGNPILQRTQQPH